MPDPKKTLSIFSFSEAQLRFLKYCLVFFTPVVIAYFVLELLVLNIPINYKVFGNYLKTHSQEIEIMGLGSSQMKCGFNPAFIDKRAINLSSTSQHHNEDFHILKGTINRLPKLKYVLLEVSYNHLELPHHPNDYWKNTIYLKYYGVNAFERPTWYKDRLVYLSNTRFFSYKLMEYYVHKSSTEKLNEYGFDTNKYDGAFKKLNHDETKIAAHKFSIINREDLDVFKKNTAYLFEMLDYMQAENLKVIVCTLPLYKTYLNERNPNVVRRRDSVLGIIKSKYGNVVLLNKETDTLNFTVKDFLNENHLNPDGAKKFTAMVNRTIDSLN
ncbi:hypothetical protein [Aequorivita antarctica]|uniref:DUF1574 domain-containing protein n=1 Tax=Aequorivita antarctica TaxID=153266 RepID=A0A5C6Z108_9FLAO|nr:hypothetical protein [Aequorivita antarctica]TXD73714.1 hypothetical protein ESU54_08090 [Aequorivita antarctica]SRX75889.1 hypothetical protein AEQU3_02886 [Aequorivita antarctica]